MVTQQEGSWSRIQHFGSRTGLLLRCAALSQGGLRRSILGRKEELRKTQKAVATEQGFDRWVGMEKEAWRALSSRDSKQLEQRLVLRGGCITGFVLLA